MAQVVSVLLRAVGYIARTRGRDRSIVAIYLETTDVGLHWGQKR
jgi:hypothetical protein